MKDTAIIVALVGLLASSHLALSSRTVRARLVARLGQARFLAAYEAPDPLRYHCPTSPALEFLRIGYVPAILLVTYVPDLTLFLPRVLLGIG